MTDKTDDEAIQDDITRAYAANVVIPDATARAIASQYHGGQATALYAFTSTGAITTDLLTEVYAELGDATNRTHLRALTDYIIDYGSTRGPVPGWSRLWVTRK